MSSYHSTDPADERLAPTANLAMQQLAFVLAVLRQFGCTRADVDHAAALARLNGTDLGTELVADRLIGEEALMRAVASVLDLPFEDVIPADAAVMEAENESGARHLRTCGRGLVPTLYLAPALEQIGACRAFLERRASDGPRVVVTSSSAIQNHRDAANARERSRDARLAFAAESPRWSARTVMTSSQGFAAGLIVSGTALTLALAGAAAITALHVTMSLFFAAHTILRLLVLLQHGGSDPRARRTPPSNVAGLPIYSVLVALHRERDMVGPLIASLAELDWPRSRLEVKLVCEADDHDTIEAVRAAIADQPGFALVAVPPSEPRTKPKALNFALPLTRGAFVVLYDAEDRPHPDQLMEAWRAFQADDERLACVQAPLTIRNHGANFFTGLFALEYAVLFRATLPFLARHRLPLPLGGTSNHFRRAALLGVGGWDSHNVAEDADLGIRLARHGYHTGTISAPTCEVAPTRWRDWRNQRTRWMKGWIQTWLVHMRNPVRLFRELGPRSFLSFQVLFVGMIAGSLMHTLFAAHLAISAIHLAMGAVPQFAFHWLVAVDLFNIVIAWLAFALLARRVARGSERRLLGRRLWQVWMYWLLVSFAGLRAALQLFRSPHLWEKTPHGEDAPNEARPIEVTAVPASRLAA